MSIVTIQSPENIIELNAGSADNQQFVVKNSSGEKLRIGMRAESEDRQVTDWLDIAGPDELDLEENTVTEIKVNIAVPAKAKSGRHSYRLVVFDTNNTSRCGQSDAVYFDVKQKETEEKKTNISYIIGVIALILVLSIIAWSFFLKKIKVSVDAPNEGSISPSGTVSVYRGESMSFMITPNPGYLIEKVEVDDKPVGAVSSYTFENVTGDHTISASFAKIQIEKIRNLAIEGAVATESSTKHFTPYMAIDGKTDGNFRHKSVTHTNDELNSWWEVKLSKTAMIESIKIWNRTDCCEDRLSNFRISVLDDSENEVWGEFFKGPVRTSKLFKLDTPVEGRSVRVEIQGKNLENNGILSLAEVEVFGIFTK